MICAHAAAVPVESTVTGEILATLCPACSTQLPARFLGCPHNQTIEVTSMGDRGQQRHCLDCGGTWGDADDPFLAPPTTSELRAGVDHWPGAMF